MITHPSAAELAQAVARWLGDPEPSPFERRVARNAADIVARELELGGLAQERAIPRLERMLDRTGDFATLNAALADAIRAGAIDPDGPDLLNHLQAQALDTLAIDQPRYVHQLGRGAA